MIVISLAELAGAEVRIGVGVGIEIAIHNCKQFCYVFIIFSKLHHYSSLQKNVNSKNEYLISAGIFEAYKMNPVVLSGPVVLDRRDFWNIK